MNKLPNLLGDEIDVWPANMSVALLYKIDPNMKQRIGRLFGTDNVNPRQRCFMLPATNTRARLGCKAIRSFLDIQARLCRNGVYLLAKFQPRDVVEILVHSYISIFFDTLECQTHGQESNLHVWGVNVAGYLVAEVNRDAH